MDGLDLTKRIRATPQLASLPVVLVTTRDTVLDRSRGMAAGADAYIVKGRFDQTELLAIIASLLRTHTDRPNTNNIAPSDRITGVPACDGKQLVQPVCAAQICRLKESPVVQNLR